MVTFHVAVVLTLVLVTVSAVIFFIVGFFIGKNRMPTNYIGTLIADDTDPDGIYLFLKLSDTTPEEVAKMKFVVMKVKHKAYYDHNS